MDNAVVLTRCDDCVFKSVDKDGRQTGCKVGRLEKFLEIDDKTGWNPETNSYIIGRTCNMKRLEKWADKQIDPIKSVKEETKVKVDCIIIVRRDVTYKTASAGVCYSIKQCLNQSVKPNSIIVLTSNDEVEEMIHKFWNEAIVENVKESNVKYQLIRQFYGPYDINSLTNEAVKKCTGQFYCLLESGDKMNCDTIEKIDKLVNHDLERFLCIVPGIYDSGYPRTVHVLTHKSYHESARDIIYTIEEKIEDQDRERFKKEWNTNVVISR